MADAAPGPLVDWGVAASLGRRLAGESESTLDAERARETCELALEKALAYTTLAPSSPVPAVEAVSRGEWVDANIAELSKLIEPLEARFAKQVDLPGPLAPLTRRILGATAGAEAGAVMGYAGKRVLGQYVVSLRPDPGTPRMLLVGANLDEAAGKLDADPEAFLLWISVHEQTHSIQFHSVPWLREHLAGLASELMKAMAGGTGAAVIAARAKDLLAPNPREGLRRIMQGELARILAGPEQAAVMDRLQASMAVVEGYAEHVMDAASADEPTLSHLRTRMNARRAERTGLADTLARILGLGAKLRQYELGKSWCDAVADRAGIAGLDRVWEAPEALPSLAELEDPGAWTARVL